jgi:hypothetical protein
VVSYYLFSLSLHIHPRDRGWHLRNVWAGCWWLTLVILAIQEAEIRRILVQSQPRKIVPGDPISKKSITKRAGGVARGVGPDFKPQNHKKEKKEMFVKGQATL